MKIDCAFSGGNILVEKIEAAEVWLRQDLRGSEEDWFYWYFRVEGAEGRTLKFHFTGGPAIGARGPALSTDGGLTWGWLGRESVNGNSFSYSFGKGSEPVFFSVTIPYTQADWDRFLALQAPSDFLRKGVLCRSREGRPVESLRLGCLDAPPRHRVLLAARHHCCETMASFVLEGVIAWALGEDPRAAWLRKSAEILILPFMDKDGVENGDQGKNRAPRDHNRDYDGTALYKETGTLRSMLSGWAGDRLSLALDLHCPWLRGGLNECIYFVGLPSDALWREQGRFSKFLEANLKGLLPFREEDNLPFGKDWNVSGSYTKGKSFSRWVSERDGIFLASTMEIPYANARGAEVNAASARSFGCDLGTAIALYLQEKPLR